MVPLYVLIGGKSSRFGQDKGSYLVDGLPWAQHVGDRLAEAAGDYTFVGSADSSQLAKTRVIPDALPDTGPLAGITTAINDCLERHGEGWLALASCDLVRPERAWLERLYSAVHSDTKVEVAAYRANGYWQPFPSIVHTRWAPTLQQALDQNVRSCQAAFDAANALAIDWPGPGNGPPQANTLEELKLLLSD